MLPPITTRRAITALAIVSGAIGNTMDNLDKEPLLFALWAGVVFPIVGFYVAFREDTPEQVDKALTWLLMAEVMMFLG